ncbi:MAG: flavohemoglobin expression-modulating QEGLA motif protein [Gammaproteobacteria bacterium]|nr:flavohemoglobin expression-modulating QEGLA motif protein [Gammaproteobacteria bacterium]
MTLAEYRETLKALSDRLVAIQRPIRILDAIKWPARVREQFFAAGCTQMPAVDAAYYEALSLAFAPDAKLAELSEFKAEVKRRLGKQDPLGSILLANAEQYQLVIYLLLNRGKLDFLRHSRALYGSTYDHFRGDKKPIYEVAELMCGIFAQPAADRLSQEFPKTLTAESAVSQLSGRLSGYFDEDRVQVKLSDGIVADAAAGGDSIKMNSGARFSERDLRVLEVHEGWVHVGTTINGRRQPWATWLSVGSPRITAVQEGLAVLMEMLTFVSFPHRAKRINDRILATRLAEDGADFLQVFDYFRTRGYSETECYVIAQRVFRGGMVTGGVPFTKDISYCRGFVENVNFMRSAIAAGLPELIPMLFVGKVTLDDIPLLYEKLLEGIVAPPRYLPPMFADLNSLYVWLGFSSGLNRINMRRVQRHYRELFASLPNVMPLPKAHHHHRGHGGEAEGGRKD